MLTVISPIGRIITKTIFAINTIIQLLCNNKKRTPDIFISIQQTKTLIQHNNGGKESDYPF